MDDPVIHLSGDGPAPQLLEELEYMFPPINPTPAEGLSVIMYRAGQRSVVEYIKEKLEK